MPDCRFRYSARCLLCAALIAVHAAACQSASAEIPTGPQTESRFPPLVVPSGFKATLFACDPLVEYPSVIALGPKPRTLYVAHDYMTGLGEEIVRRDEIRLLDDTNGDGYADKSTLFADGFNSIQGLEYSAGTVFVMHAPVLTSLRDTNGDGVADERRDILSGLGLKPEDNPPRLHCANGIIAGHDGWLYLALGDHGVDVPRPEGDRLVFQGGGILRCRPDGRSLHLFASGLRNIYDVALDDDLNVFVRDNENDGGDYMIRVCHSIYGADHGYPYHYSEHPEEALPPLADLGRGSSAGGVCYRETAFPAEFRGNLYFCEWGRAVVRYPLSRAGSGFAPVKEVEFAAGASNDPYGFKPTDVIVDRDGSLLVSDWGDGQRPKRGRGRIYRISYFGGGESTSTDATETKSPAIPTVAQLDSPSHSVRIAAFETILKGDEESLKSVRRAQKENSIGALGQGHAVWIIARRGGSERVSELLAIAQSNADPRVRVQAVRALADICDPNLQPTTDRPVFNPEEIAQRLSELAITKEPTLQLGVVIALGRLRWAETPGWLRNCLVHPDASLAHAGMQALRSVDQWPAVLTILDQTTDHPMWNIALNTCADRADPIVVNGLIQRLQKDPDPARRGRYAALLSRVQKKPGPWTYWGYRPSPRPANVVTWERSGAIEEALNRALEDEDIAVRLSILRSMRRERISVKSSALGSWLHAERNRDRVEGILEALADLPPQENRDSLSRVVRSREFQNDNRRKALSILIGGLDVGTEGKLLELATQVEDGPIQVAILNELSRRSQIDSRAVIRQKWNSTDGEVRAAALRAAAILKMGALEPRIAEFLNDPDARVRREAATAAGVLEMKSSIASLVRLARDEDPLVRAAGIESLRALGDSSVVAEAVSGLEHHATRRAAIDYLAQFGAPQHVGALLTVASRDRTVDVLSSIVRALTGWESRADFESEQHRGLARAIAEVQGEAGAMLRWHIFGPLMPGAVAETREKQAESSTVPGGGRSQLATGPDLRVDLDAASKNSAGEVWLAVSDIDIREPSRVQFLASSTGPLHVWLGSQSVFRREKNDGKFQPDSDRFEVDLAKGANRVIVELDASAPAKFHVRFRPRSSKADHERLTQYALGNNGSPERGRALFRNAEKSLCAKCHRLGEFGGSIGPDLTGVGGRFARIHLIESILEPSRTVNPAFETHTVILTDGRTLTGVKIAESAETLTLGDEKGERHEIRKQDVEERAIQSRSVMPDGLEKKLSDGEFLDLLVYLLSERSQ